MQQKMLHGLYSENKDIAETQTVQWKQQQLNRDFGCCLFTISTVHFKICNSFFQIIIHLLETWNIIVMLHWFHAENNRNAQIWMSFVTVKGYWTFNVGLNGYDSVSDFLHLTIHNSYCCNVGGHIFTQSFHLSLQCPHSFPQFGATVPLLWFSHLQSSWKQSVSQLDSPFQSIAIVTAQNDLTLCTVLQSDSHQDPSQSHHNENLL